MTQVRTIFRSFAAAMMLAAFSLPVFAHTVTLVMSAGAAGQLTAKITNTSSSGYTINSFKIPFGTNVGGVASVAVTAYPTSPFPSTVSVSGGNIVAPNGINLAKNQSITLTLSGVTPSSSLPSCGSTTTKWTVKAYEDANYGGYLYQVSSSGSTLSATLTPACYTIGGTASGLGVGKSVVLRNNGGNNLTVSANGTFVFSTPVGYGGSYAVTVLTQPAGQTCVVTSGSGSNVTANVTTVSVSCTNNAYTVGGTVGGMASGHNVVLRNNGGDDLTVSSNTTFTFATPVLSGGSYAVTVLTQPQGQTCTVSSGSGTVGAGNVTGVVVNCAPNTYTIGGTASGLNGTVVLRNNGGNDLNVLSNGSFTFTTPVNYLGTYAVTVQTQPTGQTCVVTGGSGTVSTAANVTSVSVTCTNIPYTIGGSVSGLGGSKNVVLQNNGANSLTVSANGPFTFTTPVSYNGAYAVTVLTQPIGQTCVVNNGSGTVNPAGNVTSVSVSCTNNTLNLTVPPNATLNTPFTVTVGFSPPNGGSVTLSSNNCTLTSTQTAADASSVTFSATITVAPPGGPCNITADAGSAYVTSTTTIASVFTGQLGCTDATNKAGNLGGDVNANPPLAFIGSPDWGLVRANRNKDGAACGVAVPFNFDFDAANNKAAFVIPDSLGEQVAVEYVLLWTPIPIASVPAGLPGLPYARAQLAWLKDTNGDWVYVPALACVEDDVEAVNGSPLPTIPSIEPFLSLAGSYPGYAPSAVAKMCVAQEGSTSIGGSYLQLWHKVIDWADGGARLSN